VRNFQAGGGVAVKIEHTVYQSAKMFGRHFDEKDEILSHVTRQSVDVLKVCVVWLLTFYLLPQTLSADVSNEDWLLIRDLKLVNYPLFLLYLHVFSFFFKSGLESHEILSWTTLGKSNGI
jgi:hypothetical protein